MFRFELLLIPLALVACTKDMNVQPKYQAEGPSSFYDDGRMMRPPVVGTVAVDDPNPISAEETGKGVTKLPMAVDAESLQKGQVRFNIYCTPCHDRTGEGNGIVVQRGFPKPESLLSAGIRAKSDGDLFQTITQGKGAMASFRSQIPVDQRWAIVAYMRALQLSQSFPAADLEATDLAQLREAKKDSP